MTFKNGFPYSDDTRIGACADYLLGKSFKEIEYRWGVGHVTVLKWIARTGSFKLRRVKGETYVTGSLRVHPPKRQVEGLLGAGAHGAVV